MNQEYVNGVTMKYTVGYKGKEVEVSRLPNGKFKKPNISQFTKQGLGGAWLDDARIPFECTDFEKAIIKNNSFKNALQDKSMLLNPIRAPLMRKGRFPANVLCEDDVLSNDKITKSTGGTGVRVTTEVFKGIEGCKHFNYGDIGSFSRYFSLDSWFAERIKLLPKDAQKTFPWLIVPKASKSEKNRGLEGMEDKKSFSQEWAYMMGNACFCGNCGKRTDSCKCTNPKFISKPQPGLKNTKNNHATVKPLKLMSWLITLASREGDIVLDPFCGSGTTAIAAKMLGRQYIGIEKEEEYCEIARKRLSAATEGLSTWT